MNMPIAFWVRTRKTTFENPILKILKRDQAFEMEEEIQPFQTFQGSGPNTYF